MDEQTSVKRQLARHTTGNGSAAGSDGGLGEFMDDLVNLTELQLNLAVLDFKDSASRAAVPLGLLFACSVVLSACVVLVLFGLASLLASRLNIEEGWSLVLVAGAAAALTGPVAALAVVRLRRGTSSFRNSRDELRRNLAWLRSVLVARRHW